MDISGRLVRRYRHKHRVQNKRKRSYSLATTCTTCSLFLTRVVPRVTWRRAPAFRPPPSPSPPSPSPSPSSRRASAAPASATPLTVFTTRPTCLATPAARIAPRARARRSWSRAPPPRRPARSTPPCRRFSKRLVRVRRSASSQTPTRFRARAARRASRARARATLRASLAPCVAAALPRTAAVSTVYATAFPVPLIPEPRRASARQPPPNNPSALNRRRARGGRVQHLLADARGEVRDLVRRGGDRAKRGHARQQERRARRRTRTPRRRAPKKKAPARGAPKKTRDGGADASEGGASGRVSGETPTSASWRELALVGGAGNGGAVVV